MGAAIAKGFVDVLRILLENVLGNVLMYYIPKNVLAWLHEWFLWIVLAVWLVSWICENW